MRRLTLGLLASVLALSISLPVGAAGADPPGERAGTPFSPQAYSGYATSQQLFEGLEQSVDLAPSAGASDDLLGVSVDPVGWILSAVGIAVSAYSIVDQDQRLEQISDQITQVQNTLTTISGQLTSLQNELDAIAQQIANENCSLQTQTASGPLATIQSSLQTYTNLVNQSAAASQPNPTQAAPSWSQLVSWADDPQTGAGALQTAINDLNDVIGGTPDAGSLAACAQSLLATGGETPLKWEANYYGNLYTYVSFWYTWQITALNLYVEAEHLLALNAAGGQTSAQTLNPSTPWVVCTPPITIGEVQTACNLAQDMVTTMYDNIQGQLVQAGAPYAWGSGGTVVGSAPGSSGAMGGAYAWLLDINQFQSEGCTLPLNSTGSACGGTVGTGPTFANPTWGNFVWGSYTGWIPASTKAWIATGINNYGTQLAESMQLAGLGNSGFPGNGLSNLIIYTGETTSSSQANFNQDGYSNSVTGQCLMDTNFYGTSGWGQTIYPLCDNAGGGALSTLMSDYSEQNGTKYWNQWPNQYASNPFAAYSNPNFYTASFWLPKSFGSKSPWGLWTAPGWLLSTVAMVLPPDEAPTWMEMTYYQQAVGQYRWPILPLSNAMCTVPTGATTQQGQPVTMQYTTAAGAYTMCGPDMAAWMAAQLPTMPAPSSPQAVSSQQSLRSATVSWRPGSRVKVADGYRIRGSRNNGQWRTLVKDTSATATAAKKHGKRLRYPVGVKHAGNWRFKVVSLHGKRNSRPSRASRPLYVPTSPKASRYYTFRSAKGTTRIAKVFSDGRVYWNGTHKSGYGVKRKRLIKGHTYRNSLRWSGTWRQAARGSWKHLRWRGWARIAGPSRNRKGMPLAKTWLPKY